jgi:hypothetical protein
MFDYMIILPRAKQQIRKKLNYGERTNRSTKDLSLHFSC